MAQPPADFAFLEEQRPCDSEAQVWSNAAYVMAAILARSFRRHGWFSRIEGLETGGLVETLPCQLAEVGRVDPVAQSTTEVIVSERRLRELIDLGFIVLSQRKHSRYAFVESANSLHWPAVCADYKAAHSEHVRVKLACTLAKSRFAQYVKCIARDMVGQFKEKEEAEKYLNEWVLNYVLADPDAASQELKAARPLRLAQVQLAQSETVQELIAKLTIEPYYQIAGTSAPLVVDINLDVPTLRDHADSLSSV